ncbi:hypothetical protein GCM10027563_24370 [Parasphingorhabdus pacifica]
MRTLYADWESVARTSVALLRREAARYPADQRLTELVGELSVRDTDFRQWWAEHHVANQRIGTKTLHHPVVGELTLDWDTLTCTSDPDQHLVTWTAEPGTPTHDRLRILASWATQHQAEPTDSGHHQRASGHG